MHSPRTSGSCTGSSPAGLEFGHRVMYEALRFASMLGATRGLGRDEALDVDRPDKGASEDPRLAAATPASSRSSDHVRGRSAEIYCGTVPGNGREGAAHAQGPSGGAVRELHGMIAARTAFRDESKETVGWLTIARLPSARTPVRRRGLRASRAHGGWRLSVRNRHWSPRMLPSWSSHRPSCSASTMRLAGGSDSTAPVRRADPDPGRPLGYGPIGYADIEIHPTELDADTEYRHMLRDIEDVATDALLHGFAPRPSLWCPTRPRGPTCSTSSSLCSTRSLCRVSSKTRWR